MGRTDIEPHDAQHPERKAIDAPPRLARWPGLLALTFAVVGPAMAVLYHEEVQYALVPWACYAGRHWAFHVVTLGFLLIAAFGGWLGWREWRAVDRRLPDDEATVADRSRFLGAIGAAGAAFFSLIIIAQWLATVMIDPCMRV